LRQQEIDAKPLSANEITKLDLLVMVAFFIALLALLYTDLKLQRWERGGCSSGVYLDVAAFILIAVYSLPSLVDVSIAFVHPCFER
jgi:hypothetical protein